MRKAVLKAIELDIKLPSLRRAENPLWKTVLYQATEEFILNELQAKRITALESYARAVELVSSQLGK